MSLSTRSALVIALLGSVAAACTSPTGTEDEHLNIRGVVTEVRTTGLQHQSARAELLIEEDPSIPVDQWVDQPDGSRKVLYVVLPETEILRQQGEDTTPATLAEIEAGMTLRAWNTGYVVHTGVPRAYARTIIIVGHID